MYRKVVIVFLLAVFMLAQFSMVSAAAVAGNASITSIPAFLPLKNSNPVEWAVTSMPAAGNQYLLMWAREYPSADYAIADCKLVQNVTGISDASGAFNYDFTGTNIVLSMSDGDTIEFTLTIDTNDCAGAPTLPAGASVMGTTTIDNSAPARWASNPPSLSAANLMSQPVACNTFEMWATASDHFGAFGSGKLFGDRFMGTAYKRLICPKPAHGRHPGFTFMGIYLPRHRHRLLDFLYQPDRRRR